jgi:hypothetical protein
MGRHDIFVYDDDTRGQNLTVRCELVRCALEHVQREDADPEARRALAESDVIGFSKRYELLDAIANRSAHQWSLGLLDLQDRFRQQMRGGRMLRTIREHPELRRRCMPGALTVFAHPAMQIDLAPYSFALIDIASPDSPQRIAQALNDMAARDPTAEHPACPLYPPAAITDTGWRRDFKRRFEQRFAVTPLNGTDLILRAINQRIPDSVINVQLQALPSPRWTSVSAFKQALADAHGWTYDSICRAASDFLECSIPDTHDPLDPVALPLARSVCDSRPLASQTYLRPNLMSAVRPSPRTAPQLQRRRPRTEPRTRDRALGPSPRRHPR